MTEYKSYYFASLLLRSNSYEAELNGQILEALRNSPPAADVASPAILTGAPNRPYFIEKFLSELARLPFAVQIITPQQDLEQEIEKYEDGRPDPANPHGIWRAMSLQMQMELCGKKETKIFFREFADGELVCISIAFDPSSIHGGKWNNDASPQRETDLPRFREFLLVLIQAYPVIIATLGLDIISVSADLPHGEYRLDNGKLLHEFLSKARRDGYENNIDCLYFDASVWGFDKPFVYDRIEPCIEDKGVWAGRKYYDMNFVEEMRATAERAEQAYTRMYESRYPKDDRDDALGFLSKAIKQAAELGLEKELVRLRARYEHINEVFNAQFRR